MGRQKILLVFCILYFPLPPPPPPHQKQALHQNHFKPTDQSRQTGRKIERILIFASCRLKNVAFKNKYLGDDTLFWLLNCTPHSLQYTSLVLCLYHRVPTLLPLPIHVEKAGRNHLNEEITPLLPTGIGERCSQTISNLGHTALLRRCELPL